MDIIVTQSIFDMILHNLHFTFEPDLATRSRVENEIRDGIAYLRNYCDSDANFEPGGNYAALLKEYVLRAESGAVNTFSADFAKEIRAGRVQFDVEGYAEAMQYGNAKG